MDNTNRTIWVGNLADNVTEELLYELFLQTGPVEQVRRPKDRDSGKPRAFAFITYKHACSVPYTMFVMDGVSLFKRRLQIRNKTGSDQGQAKSQAHNSSYGLGLLPHPRLGRGVIPADLSEFVKDEPRHRQFVDDQGPLMPPSLITGPPGMPPMMMPGMGYMGMPVPLMGPPIMNSMMMMMGPGRGMNRSQTWHGNAAQLRQSREEQRNDRGRAEDRDNGRRRERRHDDRKRDRSPQDTRGRNDERFHDKRTRHDNRSESGRSDDVVSHQVAHLAQLQMQMLQNHQPNRPGHRNSGHRSHQKRH